MAKFILLDPNIITISLLNCIFDGVRWYKGGAAYQVRYWGGMAMFSDILGWRCTNKTMYIGNIKVEGSIHGCGEYIQSSTTECLHTISPE